MPWAFAKPVMLMNGKLKMRKKILNTKWQARRITFKRFCRTCGESFRPFGKTNYLCGLCIHKILSKNARSRRAKQAKKK